MILFADAGWPTTILLSGVALVVGLMLFRVQRYYRRNPSIAAPADSSSTAEPRTRAGAFSGASLHAVGREIADLEIQIHDFAREVSGQLDSKMAALEHLIRDADRAAARLERALSGSRDQEQPPAEPHEAAPLPKSQADALKTPVAQAPSAGVPPNETKAEEDEGLSLPRPSRQQRHEEVYTLADYGYDAAEIAQRVGTPVGEIELILSLRDKRG